MSDGAFQTVTAAVTVVQLSIAAADLIKKIARAQGEANRWLSDLDRLTKLWTLVNNSMLRRQQRGSNSQPSSHEEDTIGLIKSSMKACKEYIAKMKAKLEVLAQHPVYFQISQVPSRIRFLYDKKFIEDQEKELAKHTTSLQVCLDLLHQIDLNILIAGQRNQETKLSFLQQMLSTDIMPSGNFGISSPVISQCSEGVDTWSGQTARSNNSSEGDGEIQLHSDDDDIVVSCNRSTRSSESNQSQTTISMLIQAITREDLDQVQSLLNPPNDRTAMSIAPKIIQTLDADGWTVLHHAAYARSPAIMHALLEYCKDNALSLVNTPSSGDSHTALMEIAKKADKPTAAEIAQDILAHGADIDNTDNEERCALHFAMCRPRNAAAERFVEVLLDHEPKPNIALVVATLGKQYIKDRYPKVWSIYETDGFQRLESLDSGIGMEASRFRRISRRFSRNSKNSDT